MFERLVPIDPRYATIPIEAGFNWRECLSDVDSGQWYLVAFRSLRREGADNEKLLAFDDRAYREAMDSAGLLHYFRGEMDADRRCLSVCLWSHRRQAKLANTLPEHVAASELTHEMYVWYDVERYVVRKRAGRPDPEFHPLGRPAPSRRPPEELASSSLTRR